jgi:endonuclease/exonuclease/phosphatase family metal-dependent hydrolase
MKNNIIFFVLLLFAFAEIKSACSQKVEVINVMTFNIRYDNPSDGINSWKNRRKILVRKAIKGNAPVIIGMQEVLESQLIYLTHHLPKLDYVGVGREDGKTGGEYAPVFYERDAVRMLDWGTFWLSRTPSDTGSIGWDAALPRICTWVKFQDIWTGQQFFFLNTHFDHVGDTARAESAKLILDFINSKTNDLPVILTGDFNSTPEEEPYQVFINDGSGLKDACTMFRPTESCNGGTFNGFGSEENPERIDMVFIKGFPEVVSYAVFGLKDGGMFVSDHWPVVVGLKVQSSKFKIK